MLSKITSTLRAARPEAGQTKADYVLILAPLSVMLALAVSTLILSSH